MKIKESKKVVNGVNCVDVVDKGVILKTFINKTAADTYITTKKIERYTKSKSYVNDMMVIKYHSSGEL